ncbi:MAG: PEGA domain-containing protein [Candidatus Methanoperedens sp.]|nr:PEGA domain-containing protein [Candidatus Methanoperedens sp.]
MQNLKIDWIFLLLLIILALPNNAEASAPIVSISASVNTSEIIAGSSGTLTVIVSETGGNDWIKNPEVTVQASSPDIAFPQISQTVSRIEKSSSNTFYFSFNTKKTVPSGTNNIQITLQYYEMDLLNIQTYGPFYKYSTISFNIRPSVGSLYIVSTPSSAELYLDGAYKGVTPITIPSVSTGSHTVVLKKSGYNEVSKTINVENDQTTSISEILILQAGSISISSNPNGADVYLDGNYKGITPIIIPNVPIGSRTVVLKKSGYNEVSKTINVEYGQTASVSETLITSAPIYNSGQNSKSASVSLYGEKTDVVMGENVLLKLSAINIIGNPIMHVQVIIIPPNGWSVTSSEFSKSGAGQFTTIYDLKPEDGSRDIEVQIMPNQIGDNFEVKGRIVFYFGDDISTKEDIPLNLPIKVRKEPGQTAPAGSADVPVKAPGFDMISEIIGLLLLAIILKGKR